MKTLKMMTLAILVSFSTVAMAQEDSNLSHNKTASSQILKTSVRSVRELKKDWNTELSYMDQINNLSAEYLNLAVETTDCQPEKITPKLDNFFKDKLLNAAIVSSLSEPAKACLSRYLEGASK